MVLGVGIPQSLVDAEGLALLDRLHVLVDLLLRELRDKFEAGLELFDELRLEHASGERPDICRIGAGLTAAKRNFLSQNKPN